MKLALLENQSFEFRGLIDSIWLLHNDIISSLLACLGKVLLESGDLVLKYLLTLDSVSLCLLNLLLQALNHDLIVALGHGKLVVLQSNLLVVLRRLVALSFKLIEHALQRLEFRQWH